jgi:fatty acid desaturase 2 (delta-6 desaturase)
LHKELLDEGYFEPSYGHILYRVVDLMALGALAFWLYFFDSFGAKLLGVFLMGIMGGRGGWLMHEGGHFSLTGKPNVDRFLESFVLGE